MILAVSCSKNSLRNFIALNLDTHLCANCLHPPLPPLSLLLGTLNTNAFQSDGKKHEIQKNFLDSNFFHAKISLNCQSKFLLLIKSLLMLLAFESRPTMKNYINTDDKNVVLDDQNARKFLRGSTDNGRMEISPAIINEIITISLD